MGIDTAKTGNLLYHLTRLDNLDSIIKNGMLPRKCVLDKQIQFGNVANPDIISKRRQLDLDEYTPFHFHPYSAFDVAVKNTYSEHDMIYMCISRKFAQLNGFKILPQHPLSMSECKLYSYEEGLTMIDWDTMMETERYDEYAKHVKMAECLTKEAIAIESFFCLYVESEEIKRKVMQIMHANNVNFPPPNIYIQEIWFR